jgi:hypothetical protein
MSWRQLIGASSAACVASTQRSPPSKQQESETSITEYPCSREVRIFRPSAKKLKNDRLVVPLGTNSSNSICKPGQHKVARSDCEKSSTFHGSIYGSTNAGKPIKRSRISGKPLRARSIWDGAS